MEEDYSRTIRIAVMSDDNGNTATNTKSNPDLQNHKSEENKEPFVHPQQVEVLGKAQQRFALKLYDALRTEYLLPNMVLCPFGVASVLTMTLCGAQNETAKQMTEILNLEAMDDPPYIHMAYEDVHNSLQPNKLPGITFHLANRMYVQEHFRVQSEFLAILQRHYGISVPSVDFPLDVDRIRLQINKWVETQTDHKIRELISSGGLDHLSRSVLISASYFRGLWFRKFYHDSSHPGKFFTDKDKSVLMDMIQQQGRYPYCDSKALRCSVIELPYQGKRFVFLLLLPKELMGLSVVETKLTSETYDTLLNNLKPTTVNITMPKFHVESHYSMADNLARMGIINAFSRKKAEMTGIAESAEGKDDAMYLSAVYHKAVLEIGEAGGTGSMEVPVANSSCFCRTSVVQFNADHPFIFIIRDTLSGMIMFIGRIREPQPPKKQ